MFFIEKISKDVTSKTTSFTTIKSDATKHCYASINIFLERWYNHQFGFTTLLKSLMQQKASHGSFFRKMLRFRAKKIGTIPKY
jgi:hypothetical protein